MKFFLTTIIMVAILVAASKFDPASEHEVGTTLRERNLGNEKTLIIQELTELSSAIDQQQSHIEMMANSANRDLDKSIKNITERLHNQKEVLRMSLQTVLNSPESKWDDVRYSAIRNVTSAKIEFSRVREKIKNEIDTNNK